jgi:hypothetical protein
MHVTIYFHNLNFIARMMKISVIEYVTFTKLSTVFLYTLTKRKLSKRTEEVQACFKGANQSMMQRQVLVILQKSLHFKDMNNEDKRVYKIVKNAFDYYAYSKIVVHFQFIYLKSIECFKRKWI